ncbi:porin [Fulvivirga ulvae]|uniref:outer membrane beta-barrel protein n=1 Tax=Fulvivirga ulvae TaxID=2904245 RepID=UPI001F3BE832|nr:outer membrane beta-barrel protein [Fulvivirga ulvae]UII31270.1 porin [Fulvivirga ulvae]
MKNSFKLLAILMAGAVSIVKGQDSLKNNQLTISSYVDAYSATHNTQSPQQDFQPYTAVGARDNSLGVNIAQIGLNFENDHIRSEVIFHAGDIPLATWSSDYQYLQAANVGMKLSEGLWLDAGFFSTHLGTESFLPKNNNLSSIAVLTYNEPFYQSGAKLSWDVSETWYVEGWVLNGYHSFVDNNDSKSVGVLVNYNISDNTSITYTNLYGRENDDDFPLKQRRFYQNVYLDQNWNDQVFLTIGLDYATQTNSDIDNIEDPAGLFGGLITARYQFSPKWSVTGRGELINDESGFVTGLIPDTDGGQKGLELFGVTMGTEYRPVEQAYLRAEFRYLEAKDNLELFFDGEPTNSRVEFLITLGFEMEKVFGF